jgi:hypothetical protein
MRKGRKRRMNLMSLKSISLTLIITALMTMPLIGTSAQTTTKNDQGGSGEGAHDRKLEGTWNVTLRFPVCSASCPCPGGVPNIPIPTLNTYLRDGTMLAALGGSLFSGPGQGSWEHIDAHQFNARFKFFLFTPTGTLRGSEEVKKDILLTGPDTFEATSTFDVFDAAGNITAQACIINETATRFE